MKHYVVYDKSTGSILRYGVTSGDINLQISNPETEAVLEGKGNDTSNKVEGGKLVNKNT